MGKAPDSPGSGFFCAFADAGSAVEFFGTLTAWFHRYSQTESPLFATSSFPFQQTGNSAFVFIVAKVLFIRPIDFFFQNFSDSRKKNNQLDTAPASQYFFSHQLEHASSFKDQVVNQAPTMPRNTDR